jgi:uncharacterized protein YecE (DUF72 family)
MNQLQWYIGCSGFAYKEWKGAFYPETLAQSKWFHFYTQHFNTLELNVTFYRFPTLKSLLGWYDKAPQGFLFSAKVPRSITHYRKMTDTERMLGDFYGLLKEGLKEKMGCVLFQLPPQFNYSKERLQLILNQADPSFNNVIEFRHESWWRKDVQNALKRKKISFCGVSFPRIKHDELIANLPLCYYHFHGVPTLFYSEYKKTFVKRIFQQIKREKNITTAYVYFNNTASLAALNNAKYLQELSGYKFPRI